MAELLDATISPPLQTDHLGGGVPDAEIFEAIERLWDLRTHVKAGWFGRAFGEALESVANVPIDVLDKDVSDRALAEYGPRVTFDAATYYTRRVRNEPDNLLAAEVRIVRHLDERRVVQLLKRAMKGNRKNKRTVNATAAIGRRHDLPRKWAQMVTSVETARNRATRSDGSSRASAAVDRIDALIVLLSNTVEAVPESSFRLSVSITAGLIG